MLALKRREGQWIEITHKSGDVLRIRVYDIHYDPRTGKRLCNLAFDDEPRNFDIQRMERGSRPETPEIDQAPVR